MSLPTPYYEEHGIVIFHGDCREILPDLPKVDLVLTDPPYGIGVDKTMERQSGTQYGNAAAAKNIYVSSGWDSAPISQEVLSLVIQKGRYAIIWGGNYYAVAPSSCWLIWDKENGTNNFADCELAWTNFPKAVRIIRHMWNGMIRQNGEQRNTHPTQKPLEVMKWAILQTCGDCYSILDPFMGSGTTLRAAKDLGRKAIGIEIEEKYCEIAARRLGQEVLGF
jgi:DNA modification methylase